MYDDLYWKLIAACRGGDVETARCILSVRVVQNPSFWKDRKTPLTSAVCTGHIDIVKLLLEKKFSIYERHPIDGTMAIHQATEFPEIMKLLVESGANIEEKDGTGGRPLHWACLYGHVETIKYLTDAGADVTAKDNDGHDVWWYAKEVSLTDDEIKSQVVKILESVFPKIS